MPASALPAAAALLSIPPFRRCVAPGQGGNGAAHYFSSAERVEDGAGVDEHAERAGPGGVCTERAESSSGELDGGHAEHGILAGR